LKEIGAATFAADTAQARGTLFPMILYVNSYCGILKKPSSGIIMVLFNVPVGLHQFANRSRGGLTQ
jgi:hypothetical protein